MTDWNKLKVVDLRAELKRRGLPYSGLKQELVQRLDDHDNNAQEPADNNGVRRKEATVSRDSETAEPMEPPVGQDEMKPNAGETENATPHDSPSSKQFDGAIPPSPGTTEADLRTCGDGPEPGVAGVRSPSDSLPPSQAPSDEIARDGQKRKRRSTTPQPDAKRIRSDDGHLPPQGEGAVLVPNPDKQPEEQRVGLEPSASEDADAEMDSMPPLIAHEQEQPREPSTAAAPGPALPDIALPQASLQRDSEAMVSCGPEDVLSEYNAAREEAIEPAIHPRTRALYMKNFMRPLRPELVEEHIQTLVTTRGKEFDGDHIELFYLDQIRSHAYVVFFDVSSAVRARTSLHGVTWPDESNRKPLWVDFVPPEMVPVWIDEEKRSMREGPRGAPRWQIRYDRDRSGNISAMLEHESIHPPNAPTFGGAYPARLSEAIATSSNTGAIPLGPRAGQGPSAQDPPVGPRSQMRHNIRRVDSVGGPVQTTRSRPAISYQIVNDELARRRLDSMRSHYTLDTKRDLGAEDEINRYTFESGSTFVDRGKEVFIGIRPPHREAKRQHQLAGGHPMRGPPSRRPPRRTPRNGRSLSDRYLPGIDEGGSSRPGDRGNFPRRSGGDSRQSGFGRSRGGWRGDVRKGERY